MRLSLPQEDRAGARNHPPLCDVSEAQRELTRIGGETNGRPNLLFEWGQSATEWARGRERIKYPTRIYRETKTYIYGKPVEGEGLAARVQQIPHKEWLRRRKNKVPAFHKLIRWDVEWVGAPRFVIARYVPADKVGDTPEQWEANRYQFHDRRPELWVPSQQVPHLGLWREDVNGPFPSDGRYVFFDYVKRDDGSLYGEYKAPDRATLAHVEKKLSEASTEDPAYRVRRAFRAAEERFQREEDELADYAKELFHDWRHQLAPDEHPISLPDVGPVRGVSRFGKAKEIITASDT
jgi:hypothetical protein